ncbi:MAG: hypothetical protein JNK82_21290 [Myxococcaceae bacterium]|nr:hypothetical protein [Myxococcaceae bacterium]
MIAGSGRCFYHPDRSGIGICVECRNVICAECTTQFEGINRCAKCLAARLAAAKKLVERNDWGAGSIFLALVSISFVFGLVYGLAAAFSK